MEPERSDQSGAGISSTNHINGNVKHNECARGSNHFLTVKDLNGSRKFEEVHLWKDDTGKESQSQIMKWSLEGTGCRGLRLTGECG